MLPPEVNHLVLGPHNNQCKVNIVYVYQILATNMSVAEH